MKLWSIVFQAKSCLKIGSGRMGMVETTELYIPGRTIWGAIVSYLVNKYFVDPNDDIYIDLGEKLGDSDKYFSSFFPSFDGGNNFFIPIFEEGIINWKEINSKTKKFTEIFYSDNDFRSLLTFCYTSTAYDPKFCSAVDESLHSMEMIAPQITIKKNNKYHKKNVFFIGNICLPNAISIKDHTILLDENTLKDVFKHILIGGELKTGCGFIKTTNVNQLDLNTTDLTIMRLDDKTILTSPVHVVDDYKLKGYVFLSVYRKYCKKKGFGRAYTEPKYCWRVGTVADREFKSNFLIEIPEKP